MDRPIKVDASGAAACKIHVKQPDLDACDPENGWRDPAEGESIVDYNGKTYRRCEVVQHEGAALESCRTSPDCPGCPSGFCVTEVDFTGGATCPKDEHRWNLRFTGGARSQPHGFMEITCSTAED